MQVQVQVMVLGVYHMHNPKADLIKSELDDHLSSDRQAQIRDLVDRLARFAPTRIAVETKVDGDVNERYHRFMGSDYVLTANEIDQVAMRLASRLGHPDIYPVDCATDLDFDSVFAFAEAHDREFVQYMSDLRAEIQVMLDGLSQHTVLENLILQNSPDLMAKALEIYVRMAALTDGKIYPGADLAAAWYSRNLRMFGNLSRVCQDGDRVLFPVGQSHAPILRHLAAASGFMTVVDPLDYLR